MTQTNKANINFQRKQEKRLSRLKITKNLILNNSFTGLLNNQKWIKIFEVIDINNIDFEIKTLLSENYKTCNFIRELENTSLLIDDSGDFIEFFEIDRLKTKKNNDLITLLDEIKAKYTDQNGLIEIEGYNK
jgi:hypothetical protein